jgi:hypothetical protein
VPRTSTRGRFFFKKKWMALTVLNLLRVLVRHSGKASRSARDLALGEGHFPVRSVPGSPSHTQGRADVSRSDACSPSHGEGRTSPVVMLVALPTLGEGRTSPVVMLLVFGKQFVLGSILLVAKDQRNASHTSVVKLGFWVLALLISSPIRLSYI